MKPTKMRNKQLYRATYTTRSSQVSSPLSNDLQKKYTKKSVRVVEGDSVKVVRGEYKGVDGKVAAVATDTSKVSIEGIKKEKTRGDKFDVYIHTSNIVVTDLNGSDQWRMKKLQGQKGEPKKAPSKPETAKTEEKQAEPAKVEAKEETKTEEKSESKQTKAETKEETKKENEE